MSGTTTDSNSLSLEAHATSGKGVIYALKQIEVEAESIQDRAMEVEVLLEAMHKVIAEGGPVALNTIYALVTCAKRSAGLIHEHQEHVFELLKAAANGGTDGN